MASRGSSSTGERNAPAPDVAVLPSPAGSARDPARFVPWTIAAAVAALLGFALAPGSAGGEALEPAPAEAFDRAATSPAGPRLSTGH